MPCLQGLLIICPKPGMDTHMISPHAAAFERLRFTAQQTLTADSVYGRLQAAFGAEVVGCLEAAVDQAWLPTKVGGKLTDPEGRAAQGRVGLYPHLFKEAMPGYDDTMYMVSKAHRARMVHAVAEHSPTVPIDECTKWAKEAADASEGARDTARFVGVESTVSSVTAAHTTRHEIPGASGQKLYATTTPFVIVDIDTERMSLETPHAAAAVLHGLMHAVDIMSQSADANPATYVAAARTELRANYVGHVVNPEHVMAGWLEARRLRHLGEASFQPVHRDGAPDWGLIRWMGDHSLLDRLPVGNLVVE
jgi:hypothetical protein